jgi:GntR family transcriptional regulator, rspAB operon transcriptional repressor
VLTPSRSAKSNAVHASTSAAKPQPAPRLRLDRSRHAAPQVVEYLREQIIGLELAPGTVLSRIDLAARFGLSQTPVRDALMRLAEEGLVDVFPQHKTVVTRIDLHSAQQAHFLRRAIEIEVVRTLAQRADTALTKSLRATIIRQKALLGASDYRGFAKTDASFHLQLYEAARVPDLWETVRRHSGHVDRLRNLHLPAPGKASAIIHEHSRIVDAIAQGNPEIAERRVREHLSGTMLRIDAIRAHYPAYVTN